MPSYKPHESDRVHGGTDRYNSNKKSST
jgi:hypothetical protein